MERFGLPHLIIFCFMFAWTLGEVMLLPYGLKLFFSLGASALAFYLNDGRKVINNWLGKRDRATKRFAHHCGGELILKPNGTLPPYECNKCGGRPIYHDYDYEKRCRNS